MIKDQDNLANVLLLYVYLRFIHRFDLNTMPEDWFINRYSPYVAKATHLNNLDKDLLEIKNVLENIAKPFLEKYPLKVSFESFVKDIAEEHSNNVESKRFVVQAGWLKQRMDIKNYLKIKDYPFQTEFGIGVKKGTFKVDEDMFLKDAFNAFSKAKFLYEEFTKFSEKIIREGNIHQEKNNGIALLHFEISFYCRTTVLTFYAFIESFVNSIGYNFYKENEHNLTERQIHTLHGFKLNGGGGYINLKTRLNKLQLIMQPDRNQIWNLNDPVQLREPFKSFFDKFTSLRDSSVHNSPLKEKVWLPIADWFQIASEFSKISIAVAKEIWNVLVNEDSLPDYLMFLEYNLLLDQSMDRIKIVEEAKQKIKT